MRSIRTTPSVQPQSTNRQLMVRPSAFGYNAETAHTNVFQSADRKMVGENSKLAIEEFDDMVEHLLSAGLEVTVFEDSIESPDAVFPNNWISLHQSGKVVLYPMMAENRRRERRLDIVDRLRSRFHVEEVIDLSYFEKEGKFLEGTGSMVFDRRYKIAYAALSPRTHLEPLQAFSDALGYEIVTFSASDEANVPIYHTNVMMCVGDSFAVVCLESIRNEDERYGLRSVLEETGKQIIEIHLGQLRHFVGNMLLVRNDTGQKMMVMSATAYASLNETQRKQLEEYTGRLVYMDIPVIEKLGGGSVRCMLIENHLPLK
jgi:hypothetical protein